MAHAQSLSCSFEHGEEGGGLVGGVTNTVRQDVEAQIYGLIDHYASQVPGGHMFAPEAKQAVAGVLDGLQQKLEGQAQSRLSGMGGLGGGMGGGMGGMPPGGGMGAMPGMAPPPGGSPPMPPRT